MKEDILKVDQVNKRIKGRHIIKDVTIRIKKGEVLGFLGPNGAGKSTTLRMIVGLSKPDDGRITIDGHDIQRDYVKAMAQVGCMIEGPDMYNNMTGLQNLEMLNLMGSRAPRSEVDRLVALVGLENRIGDKLKEYSMGMKQRLGLAAALLHSPKLLVLDEPTNGLDPQGIYEFRQIVEELAASGVAVLISSHLISEVQLMCDQVAIINQGEIIRYGPVEDLVDAGEVVWKTSDNGQMLNLLNRLNIEARIDHEGVVARVAEGQVASINRRLVSETIDLYEVIRTEKTLEELFLEMTENQKIL